MLFDKLNTSITEGKEGFGMEWILINELLY
jgi:hypothetical protein